jgi:hypothetical protein
MIYEQSILVVRKTSLQGHINTSMIARSTIIASTCANLRLSVYPKAISQLGLDTEPLVESHSEANGYTP